MTRARAASQPMLLTTLPTLLLLLGVPRSALSFRQQHSLTSPLTRHRGAAVVEVEFDHVQIFTPELGSLEDYKALEASLNHQQQPKELSKEESEFSSCGRDLVSQLLSGVNWRVTAQHDGAETRSVLVSAPGRHGARFLVTSPKEAETSGHTPVWASRESADRYLARRSGRGGVGVLGFALRGSASDLHARYMAAHPALLVHDGPVQCGSATVVEAFAYYEPDGSVDRGTMLRFVEFNGSEDLNGLEKLDHEYNEWSVEAVADHWVSNVVDRLGFIQTLNEVLGFEIKVEFETGVIAAGEAVIESTVSGNLATKPAEQVFLPINKALSEVGHVAAYIDELGQGVQHIASRVDDLVKTVSRANAQREATGEGLSFLQIPRSYYGYIASAQELASDANVDEEAAQRALSSVTKAGLVDGAGVAQLDMDPLELRSVLGAFDDVESLAAAVERSRYRNLHMFLGDRVSEKEYLDLVRNRILVDQQGKDVLYQIFTTSVLQQNANEEAPFLEFIQRVCGGDSTRPGCGGFGIRNFLTLFLSIELNAAQSELARATTQEDTDVAERKLDCLKRQLKLSTPILTQIADAQLEELKALKALEDSTTPRHTASLVEARESKRRSQKALQDVSETHAHEMRTIRLLSLAER